MFAVVEINKKQELVKISETIRVNKLPQAKTDEVVTFENVLAVFDAEGKQVEVGMPYIAGRKVTARVVAAMEQGDKVIGAKFKRRKRYTRTFGHRQEETVLKIESIG